MALTTVRPQGMGFTTGRRNLIINGAMQIAQRATSSTLLQIRTCDRWKVQFSGDVTQSQEDLSSSDTPYSFGFRKALKLLNTGNADAAGTYAQAFQIIEAQNVVSSGWNYTSTSSFITVQFWVKSSLAGTYSSFLRTADTTSRSFSFDFVLAADTWKLVTKTVPGNSGITINNDNGSGLELFIIPYYGSQFTTSGHTDDAWQAYSGSDIAGDYAQNWKNTSNSTFFITGVQIEVGTNASDFEYRSVGEELALCQRYAYVPLKTLGLTGQSGGFLGRVIFPVTMRAAPAITLSASAGYDNSSAFGNSPEANEFTITNVNSGNGVSFNTAPTNMIITEQTPEECMIAFSGASTPNEEVQNPIYAVKFGTGAFMLLDAEL